MGYNFEGQAINLDEVPQHYIDAVVNQRPALEPAAA
jgi:hypothetical protein